MRASLHRYNSSKTSCHCLPIATGTLDDEELLGQEKPTVLADLLAFASKCGDVFKRKVMDPLLHSAPKGVLQIRLHTPVFHTGWYCLRKTQDAIACNRSSLVVDRDFLARVSSSSVDALSHLLDSLLKPDSCPTAQHSCLHAMWRVVNFLVSVPVENPCCGPEP